MHEWIRLHDKYCVNYLLHDHLLCVNLHLLRENSIFRMRRSIATEWAKRCLSRYQVSTSFNSPQLYVMEILLWIFFISLLYSALFQTILLHPRFPSWECSSKTFAFRIELFTFFKTLSELTIFSTSPVVFWLVVDITFFTGNLTPSPNVSPYCSSSSSWLPFRPREKQNIFDNVKKRSLTNQYFLSTEWMF